MPGVVIDPCTANNGVVAASHKHFGIELAISAHIDRWHVRARRKWLAVVLTENYSASVIVHRRSPEPGIEGLAGAGTVHRISNEIIRKLDITAGAIRIPG